MKLRFGICGLGFAGSVLMAPDLRAHPNVEIVAACDPNEDVRGRFGADHGIETYPTLGAMLSAAKLDPNLQGRQLDSFLVENVHRLPISRRV